MDVSFVCVKCSILTNHKENSDDVLADSEE